MILSVQHHFVLSGHLKSKPLLYFMVLMHSEVCVVLVHQTMVIL